MMDVEAMSTRALCFRREIVIHQRRASFFSSSRRERPTVSFAVPRRVLFRRHAQLHVVAVSAGNMPIVESIDIVFDVLG